MANKGIGQKVYLALRVARDRVCSQEEFAELSGYISEHSDNLIMGKVFGYSVSDYAIYALRRVKNANISDFIKTVYSNLSKDRKAIIREMESKHLYAQL